MRIGTWNIDNQPLTVERKERLINQGCNIWLLTEVRPSWIGSDGKMFGFYCHHSEGVMGPNQYWAAILSDKPFDRIRRDPHPASAAVVVDKITYCSTVLPWRSVKESAFPPIDAKHAEKTKRAIELLVRELPPSNLVWGGDWNHSLVGSEGAGSNEGRKYLLDALEVLGLKVHTIDLMHQNGVSKTIDHIAVPKSWNASGAKQICAKGLSDHDAYVVDVEIYP